MKPARWILILVGGLVLLVAGGTTWRVTKTAEENAEGGKRAFNRDGVAEGSKLGRKRERAQSSLASLPTHLQAIVCELHEQTKRIEEDGEITTADLVATDQLIEPRIEALGLEEFRLLMNFYEEAEGDLRGADGYGLVSDIFYKRWGQLDPQGVRSQILADLSGTLPNLAAAIEVTDPFVGDVDRRWASKTIDTCSKAGPVTPVRGPIGVGADGGGDADPPGPSSNRGDLEFSHGNGRVPRSFL